ncbi:uncharacterized protein [Atheta coriaria]|uniref:uncharacterized protein n=1 Tax=Dalotia coriaria TaxID=877792 RepID=UPI0031F3846B
MLNCMNVVSGEPDQRISKIFYFCDIVWCLNTSLLICVMFVRNLKTAQIKLPTRRMWWLFLDYVSIIPVELFVPTGMQAYVALNKTLKIVYIMYVFRFVNSMLESKIVIRVFQLICQLLYFITLVSLIFTVILYKYDTNPQRHRINEIFYIVSDHMTGKGFGQMAMEHYYNKSLLILSTLALFVGVLLIATANVTFLFFMASSEKTQFRYRFNCLIDHIKRRKFQPNFINCFEILFDTLWTNARGIEKSIGGRRKKKVEEKFGKSKILSRTFFAEITIDMCTGIFKHSILLSQLPVAFLRDLSAYVVYEVYVQHQLICKLDELKDKMIYIHKGVVEIISDEDGETPVMKLTAGTCFSEVCLFVPYRSNCLVRCASTCIFHILHRNDFIRMVCKYPQIHRTLRYDIEERLNEGRTLKKIQDIYNKRADQIQKCPNLCWLVYVLHKMIAIEHTHVAAQHSLGNMLLERFINEERFKNHIFSPVYLTLYAVPEEHQDYNDTLFAKSTFPYVLKPDTGLTLFWEILIATLALAAGLLIPYYAFTHQSYNLKNVDNVVYFFTTVWFVDLIIQLRISIVYERKFVSGFLDILIMKLTSIVFLLDIASLIPVEMFSGVFVTESNRNYVYMNRILKLARVIRLLLRWEGRYNSNPLIVRFVCAILFIIYSVFIFSCVYYYIGYREDGGAKQFEILLFYTSQMLTGVSVWVEGYSGYRKYHLVNIGMYLIICTVYSVLYGMIFSARASVQLNVLRIKHNTKALIQAAVSMDPRYESYIHDTMHDMITIDNGFTLLAPWYLYDLMPMEFLGYLYETTYRKSIEELPIFAGIPPIILKKIFEEAAYIREYMAHEVIFHVGDILGDLMILVNGCCEVISGVSLNSRMEQAVYELNSVEIALILPMRTTVCTLTHCRTLCIRYQVMRRVLYTHASPKSTVRGQLSGMRDLRAKIQHAQVQYFNQDLLDKRRMETSMQPHVFFGRTNPAYIAAYKKSGMSKMRWMFMNMSFCPNGEFLEMWEIARCVCAVLSALFFTTITFCFYKVPHPVGIIKWTLEVMAAIDIYIRLHVAYYNEEGALVTHPSKTIIYYVKHGLLVDIIGALPLHIAIIKTEYAILNVNKILQLHRYFAFLRYKKQNSVVPRHKLYIFAELPALLVWINIIASLLLLLNCKIDMSDPYSPTVECEQGGIFGFNSDSNVRDPNIAHVHAIYIVLSIISKIAVQGFKVTGRRNMVFVSMMAFFGFCFDVINAARVFGYFIHEYVETMHNDLRLRLLKSFVMNKERDSSTTSIDLYHRAETHIKRIWSMDRNNVHKHCEGIPENLRRDILYVKFAHVLNVSCLNAVHGIKPFVRNLLTKSEYRIFEADDIVQMENDICKYTIIIYSGLVCIDPSFEEDNQCIKKTCISLGPGSIIGNLCPLQYNRLKVNMVALGVLELLYIKPTLSLKFSNIFHNVKRLSVTYEGYTLHMSRVPPILHTLN